MITNTVHATRPLFADDLRDLMLGGAQRTLSKDVLFAALSTSIAPIGLMPTLHPSTPIKHPAAIARPGSFGAVRPS